MNPPRKRRTCKLLQTVGRSQSQICGRMLPTPTSAPSRAKPVPSLTAGALRIIIHDNGGAARPAVMVVQPEGGAAAASPQLDLSKALGHAAAADSLPAAGIVEAGARRQEACGCTTAGG